jgi:hypothetical protein
MDDGEVALGTECTVISGTRLTPSKSFARALTSSVRLLLARSGEATPVVVSGARITPDMSPAGVPVSSTRSGPTTDEVPPPAWPRLPRLLLRRGGWRGKPGCSSSATVGSRRRVRRRRASRRPLLLSRCGGGGEYHVVAAVKGHELETPEVEHRPRLKRLLEATHLELNGNVFVNTQRAPTWRANCRCFGPTRTVNRLVNLLLRAPAQMG